MSFDNPNRYTYSKILLFVIFLCSTLVVFVSGNPNVTDPDPVNPDPDPTPYWDTVSLHPNKEPLKNVTIEDYQVWDQCQRNVDQKKIKSYGLKFMLHKEQGSDGSIQKQGCPHYFFLCYESQLDKKGTKIGLVSAPPYRVRNKKANIVATECETKRKDFLDKMGRNSSEEPAWHGLSVHTNESGHLFLELSITDTIYDLGKRDEFSLLFGNAKEFWTKTIVTSSQTGRPTQMKFASNEKLLKEYLANYPSGYPLRNYQGLWMLGVDLLPSESSNEINLYSFLGLCYCDMHVWFLKPTDDDEPIMPEKPPEIDSEKCEEPTKLPNTMGPGTGLPGPTATPPPKMRKTDYRYYLNSQTKNEPELLGFSLCAPNKKGKECWLQMNVTEEKLEIITKIDGAVRKMKKSDKKIIIPGNSRVELEIFVRHYYIEIRLKLRSKPQYFKHWPLFWYNTITFVGMGSSECVLTGDWDKIKCEVHTDAKLPTHSELFPVPIPWSDKFKQEITVQSYITIRGHVKSAANKFHITFLHNAPEANAYIGKTVVDVTFDLLEQNIYLASKDGKNGEEQNKIPSVLKPDVFFEAVFVAKNEMAFEMHVFSSNGERNFTILIDLPLWSITHMNIRGDIELFVNPNVIFEKTSKVGDYGLTLDLPLDVGDVVTITFKPTNESTESSIWLLSGAKEHNDKIGHTPLRVTFKYEPKKKLSNVFMSSTQFDNCCLLGEEMKYEEESRVSQKFNARVVITVKDEAFIINDGEDELGTFNFAQHGYLSWSVDHIKLTDGPFFENENEKPKIEITRKRKGLEIPYIMALNESLVVGDGIDIVGTVENFLFVQLLHGALNHHEKIGQTVLQISIDGDTMHLSAYFGGKMRGEQTEKLKQELVKGKPFVLRINVEKDEYKITLAPGKGVNIVKFKHQLPIWAVQYIRIDGVLTLAQPPVVVH